MSKAEGRRIADCGFEKAKNLKHKEIIVNFNLQQMKRSSYSFQLIADG